MDESLRQRGWSIHSEDHSQRPRADSQLTCNTADTESISESEKINLLNSAFGGVGDSNSAAAVPPRNSSVAKNRSMSDSVDEGGGDYLAMFGEEEGDGDGNKNDADKEPPKKRRKTGEDDEIAVDNESGGGSGGDDDSSSSSSSDDGESEDGEKLKTQKRPHITLTAKQQEQLDLAKTKLSKWAARLFDPNRPRGLVEPPKVIPLNDEFLTAFGKREKEYNEVSGRVVDIDKTSLDIIDLSDNENDGVATEGKSGGKKINFSEMTTGKVKIANLSYKTTTATIARTCEVIGPVMDVNLILDDNGQSSGRAYVVFEDHETAEKCVEELNDKPLEGRTLRFSLASASASSSRKGQGGRKDSRYWDSDISTKCNNCGEVGHIAKNCPNEEKLKRCGLCAEVGHEMWSCPQKAVCFNCGVPGHVSRECNQRRGLPERRVCTICYRSGHHRFECQERPWNAPYQDALCMQCGQQGHLMCTEMRWFFGLKGETCFNCGGKGHCGVNCRRPDVDECNRNPEVALQEIHMAGTISL